MTPEQINTTIHKACGWTRRHRHTSFYSNGDNKRLGVPDYYNDLNACAQFEATMTAAQRVEYGFELNNVICAHNAQPYPTRFEYATAPAPQRCEAFLRVRGLWEEAK